MDRPAFLARITTLAWRVVVGACASSLPLAIHAAACQLHSTELPVRISGTRAIATVGIDGTQVPLMVDTGAFFSFLTYATAKQLDLPLRYNDAIRVSGLTGRVDTRLTTVDKLELMNTSISRVDFVVGGNEPGEGTMGILGRNILAFTDTEYDLAHGAIRLHVPKGDCDDTRLDYWAGTTPVTDLELVQQRRERFPAPLVRAKLAGQPVTALLDSGATTLVSTRLARRAGVPESTWRPAGLVYGGGRGQAESWIADFDRFEIGGETIRNARLRIADFDADEADMLLGIDFFLSHRIFVSKLQSRIYITYNGGPVFSIATNADGAATIAAAAEGSSAELTSADQYARRGAASATRRDYPRALADLDRACALDPTSADFRVKRAEIHRAMGQPEKAIADFEQALVLDPRQVVARFERASIRLGRSDFDGARADLDTLDRQLAPQADLRARMAVPYMNVGQPAKAITQIDLWLASHPREARREEALAHRCWARVLLGIELKKALDDCDDAVDADPKNASHLDSRGWVRLGLGRLPEALADFDRSLAIDPRSASSFYGRGLTRRGLGDRENGDADMAAAIAMEPGIAQKMALAAMPR